MKDLLNHLQSNGYTNHFVAWKDPGQVLSFRKLVGLKYQYHLRLFTDGEIRGHYEVTPESHPIAHFLEHGLEDRSQEFIDVLKDWLVPTKDFAVLNSQ